MTYALIDLAAAQRQVRDGEERVAAQKKVVEEVSDDVKFQRMAEELLETFERTLRSQRTHCDRIRTELESEHRKP